MKDFVSQMGMFNTILALLAAIIPASLGLKKSSPEIVIGSFLILLIIFLVGVLINMRQDVKNKSDEIDSLKKSHDVEVEKLRTKSERELNDLKKINDDLTIYKKISVEKISKYSEYVHERTAFIDIDLIEIKQYFDDIFDEIQKWQTAIRNDMSDADKDAFISSSKRSISKIIGEERRKNYDDRKGL